MVVAVLAHLATIGASPFAGVNSTEFSHEPVAHDADAPSQFLKGCRSHRFMGANGMALVAR